MRCAFLSDGIWPYLLGGMQAHSYHMVKALIAAGVEVDLYHFIPPSHSHIQLPFDNLNGLTVTTVDYPPTGRLPGHYIRERKEYSGALLAAYKYNNREVDFIYAQGLCAHAFIEAKRSGTTLPPIGVNAHGYLMYQWAPTLTVKLQQLMLRPIVRQLSQRADFVFTFGGKVSEILHSRLKVPHQRSAITPNGIDASWIERAAQPPSRRRNLLFIGRYDRVKGLPEIYRAIERLKECDAHFHFVGPLPTHAQLQESRISYHGELRDPDQLKAIIDRCDILLCPSFAEGMPTVILEAMARGLAIVASDVGAVSTMVGSTNGILLDNVTPQSIAGAIERLCALDDEELRALKESSLAKVAEFSWENIAHTTIAAIERAIRE